MFNKVIAEAKLLLLIALPILVSILIKSNFIFAFVVTANPHFNNLTATLGPTICPSN